MKVWHISDTHLSFDKNFIPLKPMHLRRWAIGVWTYQGYLEKMAHFGTNVIQDDDFVFITGDIVHDMKEQETENSIRWLRANIRGTLIICRGNHDTYWKPNWMRQRVSDLPKLFIIDESEIISIGPYTIGCFSNHSEKTQDFTKTDPRYLETAKRIVEQAKSRDLIPVMISHYPVNNFAAKLIGLAGVKAYMSGHIHCTHANEPTAVNGLDWGWYDKSAKQTDDLTISGCFFSTGTTDVVLAKHNQSFKEIKCLEHVEKVKVDPPEEIIIMCGIPGSGKSTISNIFQERYGYVRVNQDDLGSKKACIRVAEKAIKEGKNLIIDRCNFDKEQRSTWIGMAKTNKIKRIRAIELILPLEDCIGRVSERTNHPTLSGPQAADSVCRKIDGLYQSPSLDEGLTEVLRLRSGGDIDTLIDTIRNPEKYK